MHQFGSSNEASQGIKYSDEADVTLKCILEMQQVSSEETGQNNQGGRYTYKTHSDLNSALKPIAQKYGCIILFGVVESQVSSGFETVQTKKDSSPVARLMSYAYAVVDCTLVNSQNPKDWVRVRSFGFKVDQVSDKTLGAETIAKRYALMKLANIPSSGDDDPDSNEGDVRSQVYGSLSQLAQPQQSALGSALNSTGAQSSPSSPSSVPTQSGGILGSLLK